MWETSMEGLLSLTRKTSNFYYVCEKNGDSLSEKVKNPHGASYWHWMLLMIDNSQTGFVFLEMRL